MKLGLLVALAASPATAFDLRDCPVDRVTFLDYWAGTTFEVSEQLSGLQNHCLRDGEMVIEAEDGIDCRRLGEVSLAGVMDGQEVVATYTVEWGAPCCGWRVQRAEDFRATLPATALPRPATVPTLGEAEIYPVIEQGLFSDAPGDITPMNPLVPVLCREE